MRIAVIGAGNGGHALAGHIASMGHYVCVYERDPSVADTLNSLGQIRLEGCLRGTVGKIAFATTDLARAIHHAEVIMVVTTATAHKALAEQMADHLEDGQYIVLNPGRTCGALEFKNKLAERGCTKRVYIAEAQTLVYACRLEKTGTVNIIGIKDRVLIAAQPATDTANVIEKLRPLYQCFYPAKNTLQTSFENIGAMFHPAVVLFNEAAIERGEHFYFYRQMTPALAHMIEAVDAERLAVAKAYGIDLIPASDWVAYAYDGIDGDTLCERMQNNPAYYEILAPTSIDCRQITEDIPTGIIPISELGHAAGIATPVMDALITMCSTLLNRDFRTTGRTLQSLGLAGMSAEEILKAIQ